MRKQGKILSRFELLVLNNSYPHFARFLSQDVIGARRCYIESMKPKSNPNGEISEAEALDEFARRPSTLPPIGVDLRGFPTEELARAVGAEVEGSLYQLGKLLNLKRLMRIVVAYDYNETLASIDRGAAVSRPLAATNNGLAVGIAMTPAVLHEGEPRSVMVLNAAYLSVLGQPESAETSEARDVVLYTLAHESGHVHDLDMQATAFPGEILREHLSFRDGILYEIASGCWEEYIACRLSAFMGKEVTRRALEDTFCGALERAKEQADLAIRQYRMHADVARVTREVAEQYKSVMVYAAYLLGHVDGVGGAVEEIAPRAINRIDSHSYFKRFFARLHDELRALRGSYGRWQSLEVFEPLKTLADDLLKIGGIDIRPRPDGGAHVVIPHSEATMPTLAEQMAFLAQRNLPPEN
jgi:hypothetical protein